MNRPALFCESHPFSYLVEDQRAGDVICSECGLVVGDRIIDVSSEWRNFTNEPSKKDMCRVGPVEESFCVGSVDLGSHIGGPHQTNYLKEKKTNFNTTYKLSSSDKEQKIVKQAKDFLNSKLSIMSGDESIFDYAFNLFKLLLKNKSIGTKKKDILLVACIYMAFSQEDNCARTVDEVLSACGLDSGSASSDRKALTNSIKFIKKFLNINNSNLPIQFKQSLNVFSQITVTDLLPRACSKLCLSSSLSQLIGKICDEIKKAEWYNSKKPYSVCAAIIYFSQILLFGGNVEKFEVQLNLISKYCNVAENTIKEIVKDLDLKKKSFEHLLKFKE